MKYRRLGRTEFTVSEIGCGLWGMGGWTGSSDEESRSSLQLAVDLGVNFFDTAWAYGDGKSDRLLGELLRSNRGKQIYVASKIPPKNLKWPGSAADKYEDVYPLEHVLHYASLIRKSLGVDCVDLLQLHVWDDSWAGEDAWLAAVETLKSEGLARAFGISLNRWEPANSLRAIKTGRVDCVQVIYNIFDQAPEDELIPLCKALDVGIIARVPLDEGSLGGTFLPTTHFPPDDWRAKYFGPENLPPTLQRVDALRRVLPARMTLPDLALRFVLSNPNIGSTIVGMRTSGHVRANAAVSDGRDLPASLLAELSKHRWDRKVTSWAN